MSYFTVFGAMKAIRLYIACIKHWSILHTLHRHGMRNIKEPGPIGQPQSHEHCISDDSKDAANAVGPYRAKYLTCGLRGSDKHVPSYY
jgi:hypothetical protein